MYPQIVEIKTLGKFEINPDEVKDHYIEKGEMKETDYGQIIMDPQYYTQLGPNKFVAHTIEEVPKYVSCAKCGKYLSFTEVDYASIKRMGEAARILYVEDAEKQNAQDKVFNDEIMKSPLIDSVKQLKHIRTDNEIKIDSSIYMHKYVASILDGIDENNRNARGGKPVNGHTKICSTCDKGTWWTIIP